MKKLLMILGVGLMLTSVSVSAQTAGTVNGMEITVEEANKALNILSKGKMTWDKLSKDDKMKLIQMMAPSKLVAAAAEKGLDKKEKEAALAGFWMQKKMSKVEVSDEEAKNAYEKMKKSAKKAKSKQKIPSFDQIKNNIKMQIAQTKVVSELTEKAKIKLK
jgi:flagellar motor switch/type III secretory pathway protein FliN